MESGRRERRSAGRDLGEPGEANLDDLLAAGNFQVVDECDEDDAKDDRPPAFEEFQDKDSNQRLVSTAQHSQQLEQDKRRTLPDGRILG